MQEITIKTKGNWSFTHEVLKFVKEINKDSNVLKVDMKPNNDFIFKVKNCNETINKIIKFLRKNNEKY